MMFCGILELLFLVLSNKIEQSIYSFIIIITTMSFGKIAFMGITITIGGAMLVVGIPFMFAVIFYFIDKLISLLLIIIGLIILAAFAYNILGGR